jgi:hypothetical protein
MRGKNGRLRIETVHYIHDLWQGRGGEGSALFGEGGMIEE